MATRPRALRPRVRRARGDGRAPPTGTRSRSRRCSATSAPIQWRRILARVEKADARGHPDARCRSARAASACCSASRRRSIRSWGSRATRRSRTCRSPSASPRMRDPEVKRAILSEKSDKVAGDGSPIPPLADIFLANLDLVAMRLFRLGERPDYEPPRRGLALRRGACARQAGARGRCTTRCSRTTATRCSTSRSTTTPSINLDVVRAMLTHPLALPGLSRRRRARRHRLRRELLRPSCSRTGPAIGSRAHPARARRADADARHRALPRAHAIAAPSSSASAPISTSSICDSSRCAAARSSRDLPAGGKRLLAGRDGYRATLVRGDPIARDGQLTGARPGRVARIS